MTNEVTPKQPNNPVVRIPLYDKETGFMLQEILEVDVEFFLSSTQGLRSNQARVVSLEAPDPTSEQEVEFLDRIVSGLPARPVGFKPEQWPDDVRLFDVNSLYPTEYFGTHGVAVPPATVEHMDTLDEKYLQPPIVSYKHQINECGLQFLVEDCHLYKPWLLETFEVLPVTPKEKE
ncbi:hypothetical protein SEA_TENNO_73 [Arthrobacter phage Tenno]|uniref:Uncharacterized protein n=1 Tax=Arthrobacter phage Tenno TaxID=2315702 RepID=A0A386KQP2_9CAUD|nr:hypothetical protein SEA_TENNO_73 [Arthrobacter phage Tenno]